MMEGGLLSWAYCNYTSRERKEELQKETDGRIWLGWRKIFYEI